MTICSMGHLLCFFGVDDKFQWTCSNKEVESVLNRSFIFPAAPEDPDPFLTVAQKACEATGMHVIENKPPEVHKVPAGTVV